MGTIIKLATSRRPVMMTIAAWTALCVGLHLILVPGVITWLLIPLCLEEGLTNTIVTGPGLKLAAMGALSSLSTVATLAASWDYFHSRGRRGNRLVLLALASGMLTVLTLFVTLF